MPEFELIEVGRKGIGMRLMQDIMAGSFVGEYMGEIVTEAEYHMRRIVRGEGSDVLGNVASLTCYNSGSVSSSITKKNTGT